MPKNEANRTDVYRDVEYMRVNLDHETLITIEGKDINGLSKTELQKKLGEMFGQEKFNISQKDKGHMRNKTYFLNGIVLNGRSKKFERPSGHEANLLQQLNENHKNEMVRLEKNMTEIFEAKLESVKKDIAHKDEYIADLEKELSKNQGNDTNQIVSLLSLLGKGIGMPSQSLASNQNSSGPPTESFPERYKSIPVEFLDLFSVVDFTKIDQQSRQQYYNFLAQFINSLPKKEKGS